jgi:hypothetical protein
MPNKADRYAWSMAHEDEAPLLSSWSGGDAPVAVEVPPAVPCRTCHERPAPNEAGQCSPCATSAVMAWIERGRR